tara:strand:+ start:127 stop:1020 length:894 start_codon:yes stop_codon:yes gene_type:complete
MKKKLYQKIYKKIYEKIPDSNKIAILKNTEKGACYIFGDGKSLKYYDFSSFSDLPSISLGLASLHVDSKFLNLKYSLICDSFSLWPGRNIYDYIMRTVVESIKSKEYLRALSYISPYKLFGLICNNYSKLLFTENDVLLNSNFITHCTNHKFVKFLKNSFYFMPHLKINDNIDNDLNKNFYNVYKGSIYFSIYFAYFLGFKKIYLVGCDYQDIEPTVTHWWEKGKPISQSKIEDAKDYIEFMRKFMEIKIITLNKSYGEHFISYKDFSGNNLEYKENNKIISIKKLAILKRQGIYSV